MIVLGDYKEEGISVENWFLLKSGYKNEDYIGNVMKSKYIISDKNSSYMQHNLLEDIVDITHCMDYTTDYNVLDDKLSQFVIKSDGVGACIDAVLTDDLNNVFKHYKNTSISIDNIAEDLSDVIKYIAKLDLHEAMRIFMHKIKCKYGMAAKLLIDAQDNIDDMICAYDIDTSDKSIYKLPYMVVVTMVNKMHKILELNKFKQSGKTKITSADYEYTNLYSYLSDIYADNTSEVNMQVTKSLLLIANTSKLNSDYYKVSVDKDLAFHLTTVTNCVI